MSDEAAVEGEEEVPKKRGPGRPKKVEKVEKVENLTPGEGEKLVVCTVTNKPWNEEGPMEHNKKYVVSDEVASLLEEKGLAVIV